MCKYTCIYIYIYMFTYAKMCWDLANDLAPLHGTSKIEVVSPSTSLTSSTRLTRGITATSTARSFGCSGHVRSSWLQLLLVTPEWRVMDFWSTLWDTLRSWSRRLCEEHDHRGFSAGFWWFHRQLFVGWLSRCVRFHWGSPDGWCHPGGLRPVWPAIRSPAG